MTTTVVKKIGSLDGVNPAVGMDYATIQAWETASQGDLVAADEIRVGELYDFAAFGNASGAILIAGSTTDSTRYRVLRAAAGHRYNPATGAGARILAQTIQTGVRIEESYARAEGFGVIAVHTNVSPFIIDEVTSPAAPTFGIRADSIYVEDKVSTTGTGAAPIFVVDGDGTAGATHLVTNCILVGAAGQAGGMNDSGFYFTGGCLCSFLNCIAYRVALTPGFGSSTGVGLTVENCIAPDSSGAAADFSVSGSSASNNISSDASAPGTNALTGVSSTNLFVDPANGDFTPKAGAASLDSGKDESAVFTTDFVGVTRNADSSGWDRGAFDGALGPATFTLSTIAPAWELGDVTVNADPATGLSADFTEMLIALLPPGMAYVWPQSGVGLKLLGGIGEEFARAALLTDKLLAESDPARTHELLREWELALALPDPALGGIAQSEAERRAAILDRLASGETLTPARAVAIATALGYSASVEYRRFIGGGVLQAGIPLWGDEWNFFWSLVVISATAAPPAYLEALILRAAPAHTAPHVYCGAFACSAIQASPTVPLVANIA